MQTERQIVSAGLVAQEGEQKQEQQRHQLHKLCIVAVCALPILLLLLLLMLPLLVLVRTPASRLHTEEHVEDVLRVYVTMGMVASVTASSALSHLWTVGSEPVIILPLLRITQARICRSNSCHAAAIRKSYITPR